MASRVATEAVPRPAHAGLRYVAAWLFLTVGAVVVLSIGIHEGYARGVWRRIVAPQSGRLTVDSRPAGAEVFVDEQRRGIAPVTLTLSAGKHTMQVRRGTEIRLLPIQLGAGAEITQYIEFADPSLSPTPPTRPEPSSAISVVTDPPGARVTIDGEAHGKSPVTVTGLSAAAHQVTVTTATGLAERSVRTESNATAAVMFSLPKVSAAPATGWLTVVASFDVLVRESNEVIGTSAVSRIMLPAGRHTVDLSNEHLEYRESRDVEISGGKTATVRVDRSGELSINARPWADVLIDGREIGQTPLGHVVVALGTHQVVFRHPQLGEQHQSVDVKVTGPNRVAVDLTK